MGSGRKTSRHKGKYGVQEHRTEENKRKRRLRHLEKHPNDKQAKEILNKLLGGM